MTDAVVSQVATEVIRTNLAPTAVVSQLAVEVLISNTGFAAASASGTSTANATCEAAKQAVAASTGTSSASAVSSIPLQAVAASAGTSTVLAVVSALIDAEASATGTSDASAAAPIVIQGVGDSSGTSDATAIAPIIIQAVFDSSGTSTVTAVGVAAIQAVGASSGTSTAQAVGVMVRLSFGTAVGTSTAQAVGIAASIFSAVGTSTANAVSRTINSSMTQLGSGYSCDGNTLDSTGQAGTTTDVVSTQILGPINCAVIPGVYTPPKTGFLIKTPVCIECSVTPSDPPTPPTFEKTPMWASCCDVSVTGNEIILGTYNGITGIPGKVGETASGDGHVYVSRDKGATWQKQPPQNNRWKSVTMSGQATLLGAYSQINTSHYASNTSGASWDTLSHPWGGAILFDAKISDKGNLVGASCPLSNVIYLSRDNGYNWEAKWPWPNPPAYGDYFVFGDVTADGTYLFAGRYLPNTSGVASASSDGGNTWERNDTIFGAWQDMSCSSTGKYVLAAGKLVFDNGTLWKSSSGGAFYESVEIWATKTAVSGDGKVQAYITYLNELYISKDYGETFNLVTSISESPAVDIALNQDGSVIVICFATDFVYIGTP